MLVPKCLWVNSVLKVEIIYISHVVVYRSSNFQQPLTLLVLADVQLFRYMDICVYV